MPAPTIFCWFLSFKQILYEDIIILGFQKLITITILFSDISKKECAEDLVFFILFSRQPCVKEELVCIK